jgi:asparagine synthase (glutamine-hydrolysing)
MCGIVGSIGVRLHAAETDRIRDALAHRGPDAGASWTSPRGSTPVFLGHRRLSILDRSTAANQPFVRDDFVLVYNGEIYNFRELRAELEARGARFTTTSDTEVLLEGWRAWGTGVLPRLRGMFAFGLYDRRNRELWLARDRFGIKPLFLWERPEGVAFASEIKALAQFPNFETHISTSGLAATLLYGWAPESHCAYDGVRKLPPAHALRIRDDQSTELHRYWDARSLLAEPGTTGVDDVASVLEESVRAHQIADVDVGVLLSGGLDSSLIAALAARDGARPHCYTVGFRAVDQRAEAMTDDLRYARRVAAYLGLPLHEIEASPDVAAELPAMVRVLDEPIGDSAAFSVRALCAAARAGGVPVMLSGMGADEMFGGYRRHLACLLAARYRRAPAPLRRWIDRGVERLPVAIAGRGVVATRWAKRFLSIAAHDEEVAYRRSYTYHEPEAIVALLGASAAPAVARLIAEHAEIYAEPGPASTPLQRMCYADLHLFLSGLNLTYTDRASMAASVELRVPFVDPRVVEVAFRLPDALRIRGREQKVALKRAAERYLPRDVIYRPKSSFGLPLRAWTRGALRPQIRDLLLGGELVQRGLLAAEPLEVLIRANESGEADHAQAIWNLLTLEHWVRAQRPVA